MAGKDKSITIKPRCDMLIDQGRYIDNDPIGHACLKEAENITGKDHFICNDCIQSLKNEECRVTSAILGSVINWRERTQDTIDSILKVSKNINGK